MEQHPVPQNISSYQFHLVGDMTLKQFLEVGGGVLVGVLFYALGLPGIIKWPLILISAGMGAALAFVPFEERPLEQWMLAFFRSIYSPTIFRWEKQEGVKYFQDESAAPNQTGVTSNAPTSAFSKIPFLSKLEESENSYLAKLAGIFNPMPMGTKVQETVQTNVPTIQPAPTVTGGVTTINLPNSQGNVLTANVQPIENVTVPAATEKRDISVPQTTYISVNTGQRPQMTVEEIPQKQSPVDLTTTPVAPNTGQAVEGAKNAQFSVDAAPPSLPTIPDTISGQVMDKSGKIIESAILEVRDEAGRAVRALKTNKAGHFLVVTPLVSGKYNIITEKEGYQFEPIEFETTGGIIQPIAIKAI